MIAPQKVGADGAAEELRLLHDHRHPAAQSVPGVAGHRAAKDLHAALGGIVKARDEVYKAGFAAAGAADDADGLAFFGGKADIGQAGCARPGVGQTYMVKAHGIAGLVLSHFAQKLCREGHAGFGIQHRLHAACTGQRLADLHDEVGKLYQLHKDLVHVVHQRNDITGGHAAHVDLDAAYIQQRHDGKVDEHIGQRVHQRRKVADVQLHPGQQGVGFLKAVDLALLLIKGAHHAHAGQVLAGQTKHPVQPGLHGLIQRPGEHHYAEHHHAEQRDGDNKDHRRPGVDRKGHDHSAQHHKGAAQEQAQKQVEPALHLIDIAGHAGDKGAGAQRIHL